MSNSARTLPPQNLQEANQFSLRLRRDTAGFGRLASMLEQMTGIHLPVSDKNLSLMAGRLSSIMRERGAETYDEYVKILGGRDAGVTKEFITALTTNTTEFFREGVHFQIMADILRNRPNGELRMWSAACSSGQEICTMLITLFEAMPNFNKLEVKCLATDIDGKILEKAANGIYSDGEVQSVPPLFRQKYFTSVASGRDKRWKFSPELSRLVTFAPFNLTADSYGFQHKFDIIFCRNVLIYFDKDTVAKVLSRLTRALKPGGHLFLGHSETGALKGDDVTSIASAVYRRKER